MSVNDPKRALEVLGVMVPFNQIGHGYGVAAAAVFLTSDQSSFVIGAELFADSGLRADLTA